MMGTCSVVMVQPAVQQQNCNPADDLCVEMLEDTGDRLPPPMISPRDAHRLSSSSSTMSFREAFRRHTKSSSSSTSTELCDELMGISLSQEDEDEEEEEEKGDNGLFANLEIDPFSVTRRRFSKSYDDFRSISIESGDEKRENEDTNETIKASRKSAKAAAMPNCRDSPSSSLAKSVLSKGKQQSEESCSGDDAVFQDRGSSFSSVASSTTMTTGSSSSSAEHSKADTLGRSENVDNAEAGDHPETSDTEELDDPNKDGRELEECIRKFQHQIMRIKREQSIN